MTRDDGDRTSVTIVYLPVDYLRHLHVAMGAEVPSVIDPCPAYTDIVRSCSQSFKCNIDRMPVDSSKGFA